MRSAFFAALTTLAERDERIHLIVGDLGFGVVETFARRFPDRFLNAGVAEQNMTGVAAGMALSGKIVFTYSIANFPVLRCLEQIRNDVCYHHANVKVVAVGGGLAYGSLGASHHATEDLAVMRSLPGMVVVAPGDPIETDLATAAVAAHSGPCYLRLGRAGEAKVHQDGIHFELGKAVEVRDGEDLTIVSTGGMLQTAVRAADLLQVQGLNARVLSMHTLRPLDHAALSSALCDTGAIFTLEEHSIIGGLGSAVAEFVAESGQAPLTFKRFGLPPTFSCVSGSQEFLREKHNLTAESLAALIRSELQKERQLA